jgi:hypothetical protein
MLRCDAPEYTRFGECYFSDARKGMLPFEARDSALMHCPVHSGAGGQRGAQVGFSQDDAAALPAVQQDIRQAAESVRVLCGKALDAGHTVSVADLRSAGAKNKIQRAVGRPEV